MVIPEGKTARKRLYDATWMVPKMTANMIKMIEIHRNAENVPWFLMVEILSQASFQRQRH